MLKDIPQLKVEDVALAVSRTRDREGNEEWSVYIINMKNVPIEGVLVTSKGYGMKDGEKVNTSVLRHFFESISAKSFEKVEPIIENVFGLNNEYWVSFYVGTDIYDKKYVFLPDSITEDFFTHIPVLEKEGVMIK
jgi:hypothetical protein